MSTAARMLREGDVMGVQEFGDALIRTRDLDPVYCGLVGANLPNGQLARWLLAYWSFYHVGAASWMSEWEGVQYWDRMTVAARNLENASPRLLNLPSDRWPRAAERRHFRGQKCVDAVEWFSRAPPEHWVTDLVSAPLKKMTDKSIMAEVQSWPMFGPWIAFKAADMMERVWGAPITFDPNLGLMYESPRAALDLLITMNPTWTAPTPESVYQKLLTYFAPRRAPPRQDRQCGPMEIETILCKFASMTGGHYHVGKDIHEQRAALAGWGETATRILAAYPPEVTP